MARAAWLLCTDLEQLARQDPTIPGPGPGRLAAQYARGAGRGAAAILRRARRKTRQRAQESRARASAPLQYYSTAVGSYNTAVATVLGSYMYLIRNTRTRALHTCLKAVDKGTEQLLLLVDLSS